MLNETTASLKYKHIILYNLSDSIEISGRHSQWSLAVYNTYNLKTKETSFEFTVNVIQWLLIEITNDKKGHPYHTICVSEGLD